MYFIICHIILSNFLSWGLSHALWGKVVAIVCLRENNHNILLKSYPHLCVGPECIDGLYLEWISSYMIKLSSSNIKAWQELSSTNYFEYCTFDICCWKRTKFLGIKSKSLGILWGRRNGHGRSSNLNPNNGIEVTLTFENSFRCASCMLKQIEVNWLSI